MMGGKLDELWDEMPGPDFNVAADPKAVSILLQSGVPMRFLPMNATWPIKMDLPEIESLAPQDAKAAFAKELMIAHCRHFAPEPVFRFHDPTILLTLSHEDAFVRRALSIALDESSPDFGRLTESPTGTICDVFTPDDTLRAHLLDKMLNGLGLKRAA
jgi:inosine-uridine nucleoside N-ribohydrolase